MLADLHMHSSCSDGRLPPEELARRCHAAGLRGISVTDHDCWDQNRRLAAADLPADLRWVPGIELSTFHRGSGRGFHVLGYGLLPDAGFERDLARLRGARRERVRGIAESLSRLGIPVDPEPILATGGSPGKPAIARAALALAGERLRGEGIVDVGGFCVAYLAEGRPAYVPKFKLSAADAVASIRRCGGHPVWAHPAVDLRQPPSSPGLQRELRHVAEELVEAGLEGLEAGNLSHTPAEAAAVERVAAALGLRTSAGSDFHDPDDPETARLLLDVDQDLDWLTKAS